LGPGATPVNPQTAPEPPMVEKLRVLASQAKTPRMRAIARAALRDHYFQQRGQ
jgi:hypothetical protein